MTKNIAAATHAIVSPVRVSKWSDAPSPEIAARLPNAALIRAIASALRVKGRAAAGGIATWKIPR